MVSKQTKLGGKRTSEALGELVVDRGEEVVGFLTLAVSAHVV